MSSIQGTTVIKGTFYWPCLAKKNTMKNKYTLDVGRLSKKEVTKLKELGVGNKVKVDQPQDGYKVNADKTKFVHPDAEKRDRPNRGRYIVVQSNYPVTLVDTRKQEVDANIVGEGSEGQVRVQAFAWSFGGKTGEADKGTLGAGFNKVVVSNLVSFNGGDGDDSDFDFEEEDEEEEEEDEEEEEEDQEEDTSVPFDTDDDGIDGVYEDPDDDDDK